MLPHMEHTMKLELSQAEAAMLLRALSRHANIGQSSSQSDKNLARIVFGRITNVPVLTEAILRDVQEK